MIGDKTIDKMQELSSKSRPLGFIFGWLAFCIVVGGWCLFMNTPVLVNIYLFIFYANIFVVIPCAAVYFIFIRRKK